MENIDFATLFQGFGTMMELTLILLATPYKPKIRKAVMLLLNLDLAGKAMR